MYTLVSCVWALVWAMLLMVTVVGCCRSVGRSYSARAEPAPAATLPDRGRWAGPV